ncbi:MAG: HAD family hydrolase [Firmicutes bacterium]|nr:HAD family hydrolase [Bacillota bacterium]
MNKAVFIDRDGTINFEAEYLGHVKDLRLLRGAAEGIRLLNEAGFLVIIVSNQSGIARGYYTVEDMEKVNRELYRRLEKKNAKVDAYYFCPHHPKGPVPQFTLECECRKPEPGMFIQAMKEHNIDPTQSFATGDRLRDLLPAMNLGCRGILVRTGYGKNELNEIEAMKSKKMPVPEVCGNLKEAALLITGKI